MSRVKDPTVRRDEILDAATQLFLKEGYENTKVENIVQKAEIAKGSFYNYFKSKEDALNGVIARMAENTLTQTRKVLRNESRSPKERLIDYIEFTFKLGEEKDVSINNMLDPDKNPTIKLMYERASEEGVRLIIPELKKTLEEGQMMEEFNILDAQFTAAALLGAFQKMHMAFYETMDIDFETGKKYIYDFMGRLLGTDF